MTIGGEAPMANRKHSESTKMKMSESRKGEMNAFYGKKHSDETCNKIKEKLKGRPSWSKGKKLTEEHRKALCKPKSFTWNKNKTRFDLVLMENLLKSGWNQSKVAKHFNTDQGTISKYIKKHSLNIT